MPWPGTQEQLKTRPPCHCRLLPSLPPPPNVTEQRVKVRQGTLGQEPTEDAAATGQVFGHLKPNTQSSTESK